MRRSRLLCALSSLFPEERGRKPPPVAPHRLIYANDHSQSINAALRRRLRHGCLMHVVLAFSAAAKIRGADARHCHFRAAPGRLASLAPSPWLRAAVAVPLACEASGSKARRDMATAPAQATSRMGGGNRKVTKPKPAGQARWGCGARPCRRRTSVSATPRSP